MSHNKYVIDQDTAPTNCSRTDNYCNNLDVKGTATFHGQVIFDNVVVTGDLEVDGKETVGEPLSVIQPTSQLEVQTGTTRQGINNVQYGGSSPNAIFGTYSARGSSSGPSQIQDNDILLSIVARGYDNSGSFSGATGQLSFKADENWSSSTNHGTYFSLYNVQGGTNNQIERMRIDNLGRIALGTVPSSLTTTTLFSLINNNNTSTPNILIDQYTAGANADEFIFRAARGTYASPTALQSGDPIMILGARGYGATGFSSTDRAQIQYVADQNWSDTAQGSKIVFSTTADSSTTLATAMSILNNGNVTVTNQIGAASANITGNTQSGSATITGNTQSGSLTVTGDSILEGQLSVGLNSISSNIGTRMQTNNISISGSLGIGLLLGSISSFTTTTSDCEIDQLKCSKLVLTTGAYIHNILKNIYANNASWTIDTQSNVDYAYGIHCDAWSSIATNQYGGYFETPTGGTTNISLYTDNLVVGADDSETNPPVNGALIEGGIVTQGSTGISYTGTIIASDSGTGTAVLNTKVGTATYTTVTVAGNSTSNVTLTNSLVGASSIMNLSITGAVKPASGSALYIEGYNPSSGSVVITIGNSGGTSTGAIEIAITFQILQ